MSALKVEAVRSTSSGTIGRAVSDARGISLVLDSSARPQTDAMTNSEAFLASISSCGVTLIEGHARETGVPLRGMEVTIQGVRGSEPRFESVAMIFALRGVDQPTAERLVETYKGR